MRVLSIRPSSPVPYPALLVDVVDLVAGVEVGPGRHRRRDVDGRERPAVRVQRYLELVQVCVGEELRPDSRTESGNTSERSQRGPGGGGRGDR